MVKNEDYARDSGCTACVVLITNTKVVCANAGDSRCVLRTGGRAIALSQDHKPDNPGEIKRITNAGHVLIDNDSGRLKLGDGQDLEIYHNGTDSKIRSDGHPLKLESDAMSSMKMLSRR